MKDSVKSEIVEMLRLGTSPEEVAGIMGVSIDAVCDIMETM